MRSIRLPMKPLPFDELTQLGRSIIPAAAPQWTDHNAHDPGVMLLELLSWIAEAQMYGLARTRKDERLAFARLLGLSPRGPQPASGLIWADSSVSPAPWASGHVVERDTAVAPELPDAPPFFTTEAIELTTARLTMVSSAFHDGRVTDWTAANTHDGATFLPFGTSPAPGDRLLLAFDGPLIGNPSAGGVISVGVQIVSAEDAPALGDPDAAKGRRAARLAATLRNDEGERALRIESDTTRGLLQTGLLLLRIPAGAGGGGQRSVISLRSATGGFVRAPRVQQISANVLPIEQVERAGDHVQFGHGLPDQTYALRSAGLMSPQDDRPLVVTLHEGSQSDTWTLAKDFEKSGPDDRHFTLDESAGVLRFGNGLNGRLVAAGSSIDVEYSVCQGARGNQPAGLRWRVTGIAGSFGINPAMLVGGAEARGLPDLRRLARRRISEARPVVTSADLESAVLAFADLGVTRAEELSPLAACRVRGTRILLVVGPHEAGDETARAESAELLSEIHARIAPRLALGQTLEVIAPRYVTVGIRASVVAAPRVDPDDLRDDVVRVLRSRLDIVPGASSAGWPFGRDLTITAIGGWIRRVPGVSSVREVSMSADAISSSGGVVALGRTALPILDAANSAIAVERSALRSTVGAKR
jgi:hypothetical protein